MISEVIQDLTKAIEGCDSLEYQIEIVSDAYEPKDIQVYETKMTITESVQSTVIAIMKGIFDEVY